MKKTRVFLLLLLIAFSLSLFTACPTKEDQNTFEETGDAYVSSYGENVVDYDALS